MKAAAALLCLLYLSACGAPGYQGPPSDHFDGERFFNAEPVERDLGDFLYWVFTREPGPWQRVTDFAPASPPPARTADGELTVTFINHATVLIQADGLNLLTDPIWSQRASPVSWLGPARYHPPGLRFEDLPPIDLVLVSHAHYDHLDLPTLRRLARTHDPLFVTGLGNAAILEAAGIDNVRELDWWQTIELANQRTLHAVPARHWANRTPFDVNRMLWLGFVLETGGGPVYFAGDTGMSDHFAKIRDRFGPSRLALLPIGAYRPRWFMRQQHIDPAEAVSAHRILAAARSMAIHFGTFQLSDEGQYGPLRDLTAARQAAGLPDEAFWIPVFGGRYTVPRLTE